MISYPYGCLFRLSSADLGPPSKVELSPVSNLLGVAISPPLTSEGESMKRNVPQMYYRIHYWSRLAGPQVGGGIDLSFGRLATLSLTSTHSDHGEITLPL